MSTTNILQIGKELPTNHITELTGFLSTYISCVVKKRFFLVTAAQSVMMALLILSQDLQKLQTISYPNKHYSSVGTISLIHLIWVDIKELITELEISGSL